MNSLSYNPPEVLGKYLIIKVPSLRNTYQCQLLTLVASGRSSTIHRGSPSPHFAILKRSVQKSSKQFKKKILSVYLGIVTNRERSRNFNYTSLQKFFLISDFFQKPRPKVLVLKKAFSYINIKIDKFI